MCLLYTVLQLLYAAPAPSSNGLLEAPVKAGRLHFAPSSSSPCRYSSSSPSFPLRLLLRLLAFFIVLFSSAFSAQHSFPFSFPYHITLFSSPFFYFLYPRSLSRCPWTSRSEMTTFGRRWCILSYIVVSIPSLLGHAHGGSGVGAEEGWCWRTWLG